MTVPLSRLVDERAVGRTLARYADALDRREWGLLDAVFTEDCIARYGPDAPRHGRAAIVAGIRGYLDRCGPTQHLLGNLVVDPDGDGLVSRCYVQASHASPAGDTVLVTTGSYTARWRHDADDLKIIDWRMDVAFNSGDPAVLGLAASA